jgi:hypothetical protein
MKKWIFLSVILIALAGVIALWPRKKEEFFVSRPGIYHLDGEKAILEVYRDDNEFLNIRTVFPGGDGTWEDGWIDPNENWFIYVEKVNELWLSHGEKLAFIFDYDDASGIYSVNQYPNVV